MTVQFTEIVEPEITVVDLPAIPAEPPEEPPMAEDQTPVTETERVRKPRNPRARPPRFEASSDGSTTDKAKVSITKAPRGKHGTGTEKVPIGRVAPPDLREWSGFIGNVVIRWLARGFVAANFRGLPEYRDLLTDMDREDLELDDKQLAAIAKPMAHTAMKVPVLQRNGRAIIDSAEGIEAAVVLFMWAGRVNRIAKRIKKEQGIVPERRSRGNRRSRGEPANVDGGSDVESEESSQQAEPIANGYGQYHPSSHGFN